MLDEQTVFLHVGMAKTGTTALQQFLFENRSILARNGISYPENYRDPSRGFHDWAHHILSHKWGGWLNPSIFPLTPEEAWKALEAEIRETSGPVIISSERFQDIFTGPDYKTVIAYIRDLVAPARLKIVVYVRRQDKLAESHYKELVKNGFDQGSFNDYLKTPPPFFDFFKFCERCASVIGRENIVVRVYDRKAFAGGSLFEDFAEACGFTLPEDISERNLETNTSLSTAAVRILTEPSLRKNELAKVLRWSANVTLNNTEAYTKAGMLSSRAASKLMARYSASNEQLCTHYLGSDAVKFFKPDPAGDEEAIDDGDLLMSVSEVTRFLERFVNMVSKFERAKFDKELERALSELHLEHERDRAQLELNLKNERERTVSDLRLEHERDRAQLELNLKNDREHALHELNLKNQRDRAQLEHNLKNERDHAVHERNHARRYPWKYIAEAVRMRMKPK